MPHISVKMLKGRTEEQKKKLAKALSEAMKSSLGLNDNYITLTIEDYTPTEWQAVFKKEITEKPDSVFIKPKYNPEDLL